MGDARDRQVALLMHPFHATEAGAGNRRAVIAVLAGNHGRLGGMAERLPVDAGHAEPGVVGFRAGAGEEDVVQMRAGMGGDLFGQQDGRLGRGAEEGVVIGQFVHLAINGIGDLLAAIADIDAPQAGKGIEISLAVIVEDMHPFGSLDDPRSGGIQLLHIRERMQVMGCIDRAEIGLGNMCVHDNILATVRPCERRQAALLPPLR